MDDYAHLIIHLSDQLVNGDIQKPWADQKLLQVAERFARVTGWEIIWIGGSTLLASVRPELKRVYLSIGWVIGSDEAEHRGRLPYLVYTLRQIRKAIEDRQKGSMSSRQTPTETDRKDPPSIGPKVIRRAA
jgi:hypothetical protein